MHAATMRRFPEAVTVALFLSMAATFDSANSGNYGDPLQGRQRATDSGLCRVYSYNVERESVALSWQPDRLDTEPRPSPAATERRHFICCQHDGTESACRDKTYQRPHSVKQRPAEEYCRGEVIVPGDATRHWTEDETDLFTGGDLIYCGGCCGQHIASDACNAQFDVDATHDMQDGVCDHWIACFVEQCRTIALDVMVGRPLKCAVPPPPYPQHFIQERRVLPINLSITLEAQLHHPMPPPENQLMTSMTSDDRYAADTDCSRRYCHSVKATDRCRTACCKRRFCCDWQTDRWHHKSYDSGTKMWPLSAEQLIILSIVFGTVAVVCGLALALLPGVRRGRCHRHTTSGMGMGGGGTASLSSSSSTSASAAAVALGCSMSGGRSSSSIKATARKKQTESRLEDDDDDDDPTERFSDTRVLVIADDDDLEQFDVEIDSQRRRPSKDSDIDSV